MSFMAESEASPLLHDLQSELTGAKTQWEYLEDRVANGYKDGYKLHKGALDEMRHTKQASREALMFVLSVLSVGFAGGVIGSLFAPWARAAQNSTAVFAIRTGVQDATKRLTQESLKKVIPDKPKDPGGNGTPYVPVSPEAFDHYLDTKEELDGCFAIMNDYVQRLIDQSNVERWSRDVGQAFLDSFRKNCALLRDKPHPNKDLPARDAVAKAAELAMWVAWANERDMPWWNVRYNVLEAGPEPMGYSDDAKSKFHDEVRRQGGLFKGKDGTTYDMGNYNWALRDANELDPVAMRMIDLQKWSETRGKFGFESDPNLVLDLRKLRKLRLDAMAGLPFARMKGLDLSILTNAQQRGKFLDGLADVRPFHIKVQTP
jgi:hypothetical protein